MAGRSTRQLANGTVGDLVGVAVDVVGPPDGVAVGVTVGCTEELHDAFAFGAGGGLKLPAYRSAMTTGRTWKLRLMIWAEPL
jgi:hypothetical protein